MAKKRKSLKRLRISAFNSQRGRCYYCNLPMWEPDIYPKSKFKSSYKLTASQANMFLCTGEHIVAYKDGGYENASNIVAACWFCNSKRHNRKKELSISAYERLVKKRISAGQWNSSLLSSN